VRKKTLVRFTLAAIKLLFRNSKVKTLQALKDTEKSDNKDTIDTITKKEHSNSIKHHYDVL